MHACYACKGLWLKTDELKNIKDEKLPDAKWFDIDLWKDKSLLKQAKGENICPNCTAPLYTTNYGNSDIKIDLCPACQGIWLDQDELKKIIDHIRHRADQEILQHYTKNLLEETKEIFTGPKGIQSELEDFLLIAKLFQYKFTTEHPTITQIFLNLPLTH